MPRLGAAGLTTKESDMQVQVFQLGAHLAGTVKVEYVNGRDGLRAKATFVAISNHHWGAGEDRQERASSIRWTVWGKQAENASARRTPHVVSCRFTPKVFCGLPTKQSLHFVSSQPTSSSSQ